MGIIKLHAQQWSPIFTEQPPGLAHYGALTRDPSVLHHYLLSLSYRIFSHLGWSEFATIVGLRLINVAMFAVGLMLFRKLLLNTKASNAAINAGLLFFIMIPVIPQVVGQVNYDNLQFPLFALAMLLAAKIGQSVKAKKAPLQLLAGVVVVCLLGSLNKFTFLPALTAIALYLVFIVGRFAFTQRERFWKAVRADWKKVSIPMRVIWLGLLAVSTAGFIWFYGYNIVRYDNPVVQCHQVLGPERCRTYGPWARNYKLAQDKAEVDVNPVRFTLGWLGGMHYRLFFTINGATGPKLYTNHTPLGVTIAAAVAAIGGLVLSVRYGKRIIKKDPALRLMLWVSLWYIVALWGRNYHDLLQLGQMVAINGRYFYPILPPIILLFVAAYQRQFRKMPAVKLATLAITFVFFLSGGGITAFIHYSDVDWYWANEKLPTKLNNAAKPFVAPFFLWRS